MWRLLRNERGKFAVRGSGQGIFVSADVASAILADVEPGILPGGNGSRMESAQQSHDARHPSPASSGRQDAALYGRQDACRHTLFVCEGPTDTAAAVDLGLFAAGRPNCCCGGSSTRISSERRNHDTAV